MKKWCSEYDSHVKIHDYVSIMVNQFPVLVVRKIDYSQSVNPSNMSIIIGFLGLTKNINFPIVKASKDPNDYTKDDLSTDWYGDDHYCNKCKKSTSHNEYMSSICNTCGSFDKQIVYGRSYRKIYIDGRWKYQVRYKNGFNEIRDNWC